MSCQVDEVVILPYQHINLLTFFTIQGFLLLNFSG
jgi:hypothetical protein